MDGGHFMPRRTNYTPPPLTHRIGVTELLARTGRTPAGADQLDLLTSMSREPSSGDLNINYAGDLSLLQRRCVSVIGTRKVSPAGAARARRVAKELVNAGIVIVSGLAEGVDTEAMTSAINNRGYTVGVIGTPLSKAYPAKNAGLQEQIYQNHLLISQFSDDSTVFKSNFPQRNRLMAAISDATVVIEASDTSGTLHQAAECVRLQRWLFIAKSVVENPELKWPERFKSYERCVVLQSVDDILLHLV